MYPDIDLKTKTLVRVERNNNIEVERLTDNTAVGHLRNLQLVVRFPGTNCAACDDQNSNGFVEATDGFEIDVRVINLSSQTSTGISFAHATTSTGWSFAGNTWGDDLSDAPAGATTVTNNSTDLDLVIPLGTPNGTQFTITLYFTADGQTEQFTFEPFTVGSIVHGQVVNMIQ